MKSPIASLINWSLGISDKLVLVEGLEHYADIAKTRSEMQVSKCEMILPGAITLFFAVLISACYFLTVIWPYIQVLTKLTAAS